MIEAYVLAGELHRAGGHIERALVAFEARLRSFVSAKQKTAYGSAASSRHELRSPLRGTDEPVAEIVQCGEPLSKTHARNNLQHRPIVLSNFHRSSWVHGVPREPAAEPVLAA